LYLQIDGQFLAKRQLLIWLNGTHLQLEQRLQPSMVPFVVRERHLDHPLFVKTQLAAVEDVVGSSMSFTFLSAATVSGSGRRPRSDQGP